MAHDVFISYADENKTTADAVCAILERTGIRCWVAPRDILGARDWSEAIIDAIAGARMLVLVHSSHANASPQVRREIERAVSKGLPVLPFRIENVPPTKSLEYFLSNVHWLDALTPPLERHLTRLVETVGILLQTLERPGDAEAPRPGDVRDASPAALRAAPARRASGKRVAVAVATLLAFLALGWGGTLALRHYGARPPAIATKAAVPPTEPVGIVEPRIEQAPPPSPAEEKAAPPAENPVAVAAPAAGEHEPVPEVTPPPPVELAKPEPAPSTPTHESAGALAAVPEQPSPAKVEPEPVPAVLPAVTKPSRGRESPPAPRRAAVEPTPPEPRRSRPVPLDAPTPTPPAQAKPSAPSIGAWSVRRGDAAGEVATSPPPTLRTQESPPTPVAPPAPQRGAWEVRK